MPNSVKKKKKSDFVLDDLTYLTLVLIWTHSSSDTSTQQPAAMGLDYPVAVLFVRKWGVMCGSSVLTSSQGESIAAVPLLRSLLKAKRKWVR